MTWDDADFMSADPLVRWNAHQAAKGNRQMPDPDLVRKQEREHRRGRTECTCGGNGVCTRCVLDDIERLLP